MNEFIISRYKALGSVSFVYTEVARRYRGVSLIRVQAVIENWKNEQ